MVNVVGALVLGLVVRTAELSAMSPELRAFLAVGLCGAFTTFSTFSYETVQLLQAGLWPRAAAYALGSLALGLAALAAGLALAPLLLRGAR